MADILSAQRNERGEWRPANPIALPPINNWPLRPSEIFKWMFGFPGFVWPYNAFWLGTTLLTWAYLTPEVTMMVNLEPGWIALLLARNVLLITILYGGLHLYFYIFKAQGDSGRFSNRPFATDSRRFLFRNQVFDNLTRTLGTGVPIITAYEVVTCWAFANGYRGLINLGTSPFLFWTWFVFLIFLAPIIHAIHFYLGHRLLHIKFLYKHVHVVHHRNVDIGPWSGLAMHPAEQLIYLSTIVVQWLLALHPVNAIYQLHLASFYAALAHCGFEKFKIGKKLGIEGASYFHYLHHKYFECNYGGSVAPLDKWFGTFHDGTAKADAIMRARMKARRGNAAAS